jgi:hypothetical protein
MSSRIIIAAALHTEKLVMYEGVSKSFRTGRLEGELQMVQLSATRCNCIAILWVSLTSFAAVTRFVASQRVFIVVSVYLVIESVRKLLDTPSYVPAASDFIYFMRSYEPLYFVTVNTVHSVIILASVS